MFNFPTTDPLAGFGQPSLGLDPSLVPHFAAPAQQPQPHSTLLGSVLSAYTGGMLGNKGQGGGGGLLQATGNSAGGLLGGSFNVPGAGHGMLTTEGGFGGVNPFTGGGFGSMAPGGMAQFPGGYQAPADALNLPF